VVIAGALLSHRLLGGERLRIAAYVRGRDLATDVGERGHGSLAELEGGVRIVDGRRDRAPEQNFSVEASLRLIATLHDPAVIRKILAHLPLCHSGQSPDPAPPESGAAAS